MVDKKWIGQTFPILTVDVEKGQLRFFAKSIGEQNAVYIDEEAAKAAGYRSLLAPPTFAFTLSLATPDPFAKYVSMGIDPKRILHGGQKFEYFAPICAGDKVTLETTVTDIFEKKGGALEFVEEETVVTNGDGKVVARLFSTLVMRNQGANHVRA